MYSNPPYPWFCTCTQPDSSILLSYMNKDINSICVYGIPIQSIRSTHDRNISTSSRAAQLFHQGAIDSIAACHFRLENSAVCESCAIAAVYISIT